MSFLVMQPLYPRPTQRAIQTTPLQGRRWCDTCDCASERDVHDCGRPTRRAGGIAWLTNDAVNLACGLMGGLVALGVTR